MGVWAQDRPRVGGPRYEILGKGKGGASWRWWLGLEGFGRRMTLGDLCCRRCVWEWVGVEGGFCRARTWR